MTDFWTSNPAYQEYKAARWRQDDGRAAQLVEVGLTSPDPVERAHWLTLKASLCAHYGALPGNMDLTWKCLNEALQTGPDSYSFRRGAFQVALGVIVYEGSRSGLAQLLQRLRPDLSRLLREPAIAYNIGVLRCSAGQWLQARLWFNRAFAAGYRSSGGAAGQAVPLSALASVCIHLGRMDEAEALLQEASRCFQTHGNGMPLHRGLVTAQAELELVNGRTQAARTLMQQYLANSPNDHFPHSAVRFNLLAAQIALAEGNPEGYRHFCDLALATCRKHDLSISIHLVHAVMAEAERNLCYHQKKATRQV